MFDTGLMEMTGCVETYKPRRAIRGRAPSTAREPTTPLQPCLGFENGAVDAASDKIHPTAPGKEGIPLGTSCVGAFLPGGALCLPVISSTLTFGPRLRTEVNIMGTKASNTIRLELG